MFERSKGLMSSKRLEGEQRRMRSEKKNVKGLLKGLVKRLEKEAVVVFVVGQMRPIPRLVLRRLKTWRQDHSPSSSIRRRRSVYGHAQYSSLVAPVGCPCSGSSVC